METTDVRLARLEEQFKTTAVRVIELQVSQERQTGMLVQLVAAENQRKGARAVGRIILGIITSGGFLGWIWEHFHK